MLGVKASPGLGWPVIVEACGPQQIPTIVLPTLHEEIGVQEGGVPSHP
jgi:hypothetical protein